QTARTGRHCQIKNRNGRPPNICDTAHDRTGFRQQGQFGALQHLPNLEHVDPIQLLAVKTEQQQLKAILPYQLRALVHRIHYTSHAQTPTPTLKIRCTFITKRHGACFLTAMNAKTTFFRHLTSTYRKLLCALSALCFFTAGSPAVADPVTLPDLLIGVTQGFLEFTVEDYLATSHTEGRYE